MRRLTEAEGQLLADARRLVRELGENAHETTGSADQEFRAGVIFGRCDRAEDAIFDVLNGLSSYLDDPVAAAYLSEREHVLALTGSVVDRD